MQCIRCGREMENTTGGNYHCPSCSFAVNDLVYRPSEWKPFPQGFGKQEGWICPVCGRGVAPWADVCPCQGSEMKITYGTSTGIEMADGWEDYYAMLERKNNIEHGED